MTLHERLTAKVDAWRAAHYPCDGSRTLGTIGTIGTIGTPGTDPVGTQAPYAP